MSGVGVLQLLGGGTESQKKDASSASLAVDGANQDAFQAVIEQKVDALGQAALALAAQFPGAVAGQNAQGDADGESGGGLMARLVALLQGQVAEMAELSKDVTEELATAFIAYEATLSPELGQQFQLFLSGPTEQNLGAVQEAIGELGAEELIGFASMMEQLFAAVPQASERLAQVAQMSKDIPLLPELKGMKSSSIPKSVGGSDATVSQNVVAQPQTAIIAVGKSVAPAVLASQTMLSSATGAAMLAVAGEVEAATVPPAVMAFAAMGDPAQSAQNTQKSTIGEIARQLQQMVLPAQSIVVPSTAASAAGVNSGGKAQSTSGEAALLQAQSAMQVAAASGGETPGAASSGANGMAALLQSSSLVRQAPTSPAGIAKQGGELSDGLMADSTLVGTSAQESDILATALKGAGDTSLASLRDEGSRPTSDRLAREATHPREQVVVQMKRSIETGQRQFMIQLDPADLGRVEVRLETMLDGKTQLMVVADQSQTLDLLERDSRQLWKSLTELGLQLEHSAMEFQLSQDGQGGQPQDGESTADGYGSRNIFGEENGTALANKTLEQYERLILTMDEGVNIRV